jgi:hypothetical protein
MAVVKITSLKFTTLQSPTINITNLKMNHCSGVVHFEAGDIDCLLGEWFILQLMILTVEGWFILRLVILTLLRNGSF